jgi:four helix bundle protein
MMATVKRFEDLDVFKMARELTRCLYRTTAAGRFARDYALRDQVRRAAVSVMSNIAEGFERGGDKEFFQFLSLAKASCGEVRAQLYVALDQAYVTQEEFDSLVDQALRINAALARLMKYLRDSELRGSKFRAAAAP